MKSTIPFSFKSIIALVIVITLLIAMPIPPAYAATAGPNGPTSSAGTGANWINPNNALTSNTVYATFTGTSQQYLVLTVYGFAIPAGSTINGIQVSVKGYSSGTSNNNRTIQVALTKNGTAVVGTAKTQALATTDNTFTLGTTADLWGTTWALTDINATTFGVMIRDNDTTSSGTFYIDYVSVIVTYTLPATTTTVTSSLNPSQFGDSVTFTATVTPTAATGTVTFMDGANTIGTGTLNASGVATFSTSTLVAGSHSITAVYNGDANYSGSTSAILTQAVNQAPAITSANAATFMVGTPGTFTVTANGYPASTFTRSGDALPNGVTFNGSTGVLSGTPASGTVGTYNFVFTASNGIAPDATQNFTLTVVKGNQTITFNQPPTPAGYGTTYTIAPTASSGLSVTVTASGACTIAGYVVSYNNGLGVCTLTASQGGDASWNAAPNVTRTVQVQAAATTTTITSSANPSVLGQMVTFTVRVTSAGGTPTGTVTLSYCPWLLLICTSAQQTIGTANLVGGIATFNVDTLPVGRNGAYIIPDRIFAVYTPTAGGNFNGSNSTLDQTVNTANTITSLTSSINPSSSGQAVTFTATVTVAPPGAGQVAGGTVTFFDGATQIGTGTVNASGIATFTTSTLAMGSHNITAYFQGTDDYGTSTSPILVQMVRRTSATTLTSNLNPSIYGQSVTFTATVTGPSGTPTGTVSFYEGTTLLGTGTLTGGVASMAPYSFLPVGSHNITAVYSGDANYVPSTSAVLIQVVNQATLTVTADPKTITYGDADPPFTYTYSGFVLGDTASAIDIPPSCDAPATHINAGTYAGIIICSGAVDDNYTFTYVNGTLTVSPKPLTITADNQGKTYGFTLTFDGTEFTTSGLIFNDTVDSVTLYSDGAPASAPTGTYSIVPSAAVGTGLNNYTITYVNGTLTVGGNVLIITANDQTKTYGQALTFAGTEFTVTGLKGTDHVNSVSLASVGTAANAPVGTYPIVASNAVGVGLGNYVIVYTAGQLDVNQATLTFDPDSHTKTYGDTFTGYTGTFTGLFSFDNSITPVYDSPGAPATATTGTYPINVSFNDPNDRLRNYILTVDPNPPATLTVLPRALTVTPTNRSKVYGQVLTSADFTGTITGIQNGDNITAIYDSPTGDPATAAVGTYNIVATLSDPDHMLGNYTVANNVGTLTVTQRDLIVTSDNQTKIYGDTFTAFTGSIVGLQNNDNITPNYASTGAVATALVGTYQITITLNDPGNKLANYHVTYNIGTLAVIRRTLTITPDDQSKVYGDTFAAFTGVVTGLQNGDAITPTYSSPGAIATAIVGTYPITVTLSDPGNKLGNYDFTLNTGTLTVTKRDLVVTPDNKYKDYGTWFIAFTGTITGIQNGENITANYASAGSPPSAAVGTYPITATLNDPTGKLGNYNVILNQGTLTVGSSVLTVTADNKTIAYGTPDPVFTFTYNGFAAGDTPAVIDTPPTCTVSVPHTDIGTYPIVCSGGIDNAYTFVYVQGTLTVTKRTLVVTPADKIKVYGDVFSAFTGTITGIQYGENITANYSSLGAPATAPVGTYDITATLNDPDGRLVNYNVVYNTGTLTVIKRALVVSPDNKTKVYGDTFTAYTATITGIQNADPITVNYTCAGAVANANVGTYPITVTLNDPNNDLPNYDVTLNTATLTVTPRTLIVTPDNKAKVFGTTFTAFTGTVVGLQAGDNITVTYDSTGAPASAPAGTYPITAALNDPNNRLVNYAVTLNQGTLTVGTNVLTVTADNKTKVYGDPDPAFTFTYAGFQGSDNASVIDTPPTCVVAVAHNAVGNYPITCSGGADNNYIFTYMPGTLTVTPRALTVTPDNKTKVYGDTFTAFTGTVTGLQAGDNITVTYASAGAPGAAAVGTYSITATLNDPNNRLSNYAVTLNTGTLTVTTRALTVTPDDKNKVYGTAFTAFTGNTTGLQGGDSITVTYASAGAPATAAVGTYPITATLGDPGNILGNYSVTLNTGTLTVTKRDLVVTPADKTKIYGDVFTAFTGTIIGIQNGDPITATYASAGAVATAPIGTYNITVTLNASAAVLANYNVTLNTGTLTVTQRTLIVTPDDKAKAFGTTFTAFTGTVVGLAAGDNITPVYASTGAPASAPAGTYPITVTLNDPNNRLSNYIVTLHTGTLTVGTNVLTVTADNKTIVYGTADPAFTFTYAGFQAGDTPASLTTQPTCQVAVAHNAVGTFPITCSGGVDDNYVFTYVSGTLTVTPRALTVTPANKTKVYGDTFTAFTGTVTGIQGGDSITVTYNSNGAAATAGVGTYPITATLDDPLNRLANYTVTLNSGTLTVTPRALTVTPDDKNKVYGTVFTAFTGNIAGIQNADNITATYASTGAPAAAAVGTYQITATLNAPAGVLANYTVTLNTGTLTVTGNVLIVTPADKTKVYGDTFTAFTGTVVGLQPGDNITVTYASTGAAANATVGSYNITATLNDPGNKLPNYTVILNTGTLTVTPRALMVTPDNKAKAFGTTFTAFTGTITGLQAGDNITATYSSTGAPAAAAAGTYPITATLNDPNNRLPNYTVTLNTGTLTVGNTVLTVTADNKTITYGDPDPTFTFTYAGFVGGDTPAVIDTPPTCQVSVAHNAVGAYQITCAGGIDNNYVFSYVPGTLTVNPRVLTVTPDNKSKVYGDVFTAFTGTVTGLQASDNITVTYNSTGAPAAAAVGTYPITVTLTDPNNRIGNYAVTLNTGTLTVTTRPLIVTPDNKNKVYGTTFTAFTGSIVGVQAGDNITVTYASTGAAATAGVGTYPITATLNDPGNKLSNYAVTLNTGTLTVTGYTLIVTPADKIKTYGDVFTAFTGTVVGLQPGDNITVTYSSAGAAANANVGTYNIIATLNDPDNKLPNYTVILNTGTLTVNQRALIVTPDSKAKAFGTTFTAFTGTVIGLQAGDNITPVYASTGAPASAAVGSYPITVTLNDPNNRLPNYTVTLNTGTLTVGNTVLTVTADNKAITYGDPDPTFTFTYAGFVGGDTPAVIDTPPTCQVPVAHNAVGVYPITCSGGIDNNYVFSYIPGTLTVNPRALTVSPANQTKAYGDVFTAFTGTVTGIQTGDNITVNYASTGAPAAAAVGTYPIIATLNDPNGRLTNYTVTLNTGTLTVTTRQLTVTTDDKNKVYGSAFTAFTGSIVGIQASDNITATYASLGSPATAAVGTYPITATLNDPGNKLSNYTVTTNTGTLTVTQYDLVVTPADKTKVFGTVFTAFTGTITGIQNGDNITATYASTGAVATAAAGTYDITATLNDPTNKLPNYNVTLNTGTLTVTTSNQTITVTTSAPTSAAMNSSFTVAATASSGLPVTYSATGSCTNVGATFTMNSATGICRVHYNQAGNGNYDPAPEVIESVNATANSQTITVTVHAPSLSSMGSKFDVAATASSGLPVAITVSGGCSSVDHGDGTATITITSTTGSCIVHYNQAGNATYSAAPQVTETVSLDTTAPTETVNQAASQADPTNASPINFTVVFSKSIIGFSNTGVKIDGTAGADTAVVTEIAPNDGTTFNIAISGMKTDGTVIVSVPAGVVKDLAGNDNFASSSTDNVVTYFDGVGPSVQLVNTVPDTGDGVLKEDEVVTVGITQFSVKFNQDVYNPEGDSDVNDVTNPSNYMLVRDLGDTAGFQTVDCAGGVVSPADTQITIVSVTSYVNNTVAFNVNGGLPLSNGNYRLYVCGTTSIVDPLNTALKLVGNNGAGTDFIRNFVVNIANNGGGNGGGGGGGNGGGNNTRNISGYGVPVTGFAPGKITQLPKQPASAAYSTLDGVRLEIPVLSVNVPIVGVSLTQKGWDLTWLENNAGYLEGSAYPTWAGNTVLTGHVIDASNAPGPFANIKDLQIGDRVMIHMDGYVYVYEVQENRELLPSNLSAVFQHEDYNWVTLVTCEDYNLQRQSYNYRRIVRAILVSIVPE